MSLATPYSRPCYSYLVSRYIRATSADFTHKPLELEFAQAKLLSGAFLSVYDFSRWQPASFSNLTSTSCTPMSFFSSGPSPALPLYQELLQSFGEKIDIFHHDAGLAVNDAFPVSMPPPVLHLSETGFSPRLDSIHGLHPLSYLLREKDCSGGSRKESTQTISDSSSAPPLPSP